jgi:hypothetical protein
MIQIAQRRLGVPLPSAYIDLIRNRNGGEPVRRCYRTPFPTSWADDRFEISGILGIGGEKGVDVPGPLSSSSLIAEWGYPNIGVVICDTPSGGHDTVMLDYTTGTDEPAVAYVDEDRIPRRVAESFQEFLDGLFICEGSQS